MQKMLLGTVLVLMSLVAVGQNASVTQNVSATQPTVKSIGESAFTVPAGMLKDYTFSVPQGLKNVGLFGKFKATGGVHNDIVVMSDDQYVNWRNSRDKIRNNPIKEAFNGALYDSRQVTQGTIKLALPDPGLHHVVFYNGFSILTPKAVEANIAVQYIK